MTSIPSFKTVNVSVRPGRVAVLTDRNDPEWQSTCLRIIEFFSRLWGGAYNVIVPTDGKAIDERFWTILETFDPDYVYVYRKSGEDIRLGKPEEYRKLLEARVGSWVAQFGKENPGREESIRHEIDKGLRGAVASNFAIATELQAEIKLRIAPFYFQEWIVDAGAVSANSGGRFPLTAIANIISNTEHPDRFAEVTVATDTLPPLWYAAVCGALSEKGKEEFEKVGVARKEFSFAESDLGQLVEFVVNGELRGPWVLQTGKDVFMQLNGIAPFQISMLQLGLYRSPKYLGSQPMVLVTGRTVEDFCLYYGLSRLRERVVWTLPSIVDKALSTNPEKISRAELNFVSQINLQKYSQQTQGGLASITYSLADSEHDAVIAWLNSTPMGRLEPISTASEVPDFLSAPLVAIERDNFQRDIPVQMSGDLSISPFTTPKPKNFPTLHPYEHRYITQLSVTGEAPPKHFALGKEVIVDHRLSTHEARVGRYGPAYFCPNVAYFGGDIDTVLVRPHLRLPTLPRMLVDLALEQGLECRPSDKGIYADEALAKWGGLDKIAMFLQDGANRGMMDLFLDRSDSEAGRGVYLSDDRRRYLDFSAMKKVLGDRAGELIDALIARQILYRGFIFRCGYCRNSTWFSVADITQEFKCRRCSRSQIYTKAHWKMPEEPAWFYKLDELVYQGYRQGMSVPLLALNYLRLECSENFSFSTDREFWKPGASRAEAEVDLSCVSDGVLTVGEAKKENRLGNTAAEENSKIAKYKMISGLLAVRRLVFATEDDSWSTSTVERVNSSFASTPHVTVRVLGRQAPRPELSRHGGGRGPIQCSLLCGPLSPRDILITVT